ncbi:MULTISPECIES: transglycosylase SLT domain-containing protein [Halomonas]|uniref:Transglycosylase n=1 Tax=Halomonas halophila TaxID=29573 RepID=A0ABQ0TZA5_9GAMM|nr:MULTISPECIES: transglycosylase SLT domain-containing protein [Halomonas]MDR5889652.1 transglycosylase SLT domain-containing protein [Halomonas salina]WJY06334.1 transglycosylase SLT domain-containing protein [Halomonas halophila]GEK71579.1 transglycosylase [Halomonas halophila]
MNRARERLLEDFAQGVTIGGAVMFALGWVLFCGLRTRTGIALLLLTLLMASCHPAVAQPIPSAAERYHRELTRVVQQEWGLDGRVALHGAQIHQESAWRPHVDSPVGAQGLSQFMPSTSSWIAELYPDLGAAAPYSPGWAMRAQTRYNRFHWRRIDAADQCQHWAMTLSAYNGGLGWVYRDQKLARAAGDNPGVWFGSVEEYTRRAGWAERENRAYVRRILLTLTPRYVRAGWAGGAPCGG